MAEHGNGQDSQEVPETEQTGEGTSTAGQTSTEKSAPLEVYDERREYHGLPWYQNYGKVP